MPPIELYGDPQNSEYARCPGTSKYELDIFKNKIFFFCLNGPIAFAIEQIDIC